MRKLMLWSSENLGLLFLACLTLGLAPFAPEPHVWQKITWLTEGQPQLVWYDWFDLLLHGSPWLLLTLGIIGRMANNKNQTRER